MQRRKAKLTRKPPRQARSQATVSAILDATVRIFEREGFEAATTTRIATVAGVSVGTLYQYFSHREAIVDALQDREFERAFELVRELLSENNLANTPRETTTRVLRALMSLYSECPGLHRVLTIEGLSAVKADRVHAFDLRIIAIIRHFLAATGAPVRRENVDAAAFLAFQAVRASMLAYLLERPAGLSEESLVTEVADMILRYLVDDSWAALEKETAVIEPPKSERTSTTRLHDEPEKPVNSGKLRKPSPKAKATE